MSIRTNETKPLTRQRFSHEKQTEPAACGRAKLAFSNFSKLEDLLPPLPKGRGFRS